LRARAIETQCYVIAPAQAAGEHFTGRRSYGHALIVDPWGAVVARCPATSTSDEFAIADIDPEVLLRVRREMPLWEQRRADVYELMQK
jgi:deaminated glutathione amidase